MENCGASGGFDFIYIYDYTRLLKRQESSFLLTLAVLTGGVTAGQDP